MKDICSMQKGKRVEGRGGGEGGGERGEGRGERRGYYGYEVV